MTNKNFDLYITEERQRLCVMRHFDGEGVTLFTEEDIAAMVKIVKRGEHDGTEVIRAVASKA